MGRTVSLCLFAVVVGSVALAVTLYDAPVVQGEVHPLQSPDEMYFEAERSRQLDFRIESLNHIRAQREKVIADLENGDLSLDDALNSFRAINQQEPVGWQVLHNQYRDRQDDEIIGFQLAVAASNRAGRVQGGESFLHSLIDRLRERFGSRALIPPHLESPS